MTTHTTRIAGLQRLLSPMNPITTLARQPEMEVQPFFGTGDDVTQDHPRIAVGMRTKRIIPIRCSLFAVRCSLSAAVRRQVILDY